MSAEDEFLAYGSHRSHSTCSSKSSFGVQGSFDPMMHVLELAEDVAAKFSDGPVFEFCARGDPKLLAFATFLHETIHWWQFTGTTSGLAALLSRPTQAFVLRRAFKNLPSDGSILPKPGYRACSRPGHTDVRHHNLAVNGWMDIEFASALLMSPENAPKILKDPFFESVALSYSAYLSDTIGLLRATIGDSPFLTERPQTSEAFDRLVAEGTPGFSRDAPIVLPPLGLRAIQEGQARFAELQFRYIATRGEHSWPAFEAQGLLGAEYRTAFDLFLKLTRLEFPKTPLDPAVNLFLLVCDIAMMTTHGYPDCFYEYSGFIRAMSPGLRFLDLLMVFRVVPPEFLDRLLDDITLPSAEAYRWISGFLCEALSWAPPQRVLDTIVQRTAHCATATRIRQSAVSGEVEQMNPSIAYIFGRHLGTIRDRAVCPDFFCWPAYYLVDGMMPIATQEVQGFLERSAPPFFRASKQEPIGVTRHQGITREKASELVSIYFFSQFLYNLGTQWIISPGGFDFDFRWADPRWSIEDFRKKLAPTFEQFYGCSPDAIPLL